MVLLLIEHFPQCFSNAMNRSMPRLDPDALGALVRYQYSDNVRELKLVIERAVFTANSGVIQINDVLVS